MMPMKMQKKMKVFIKLIFFDTIEEDRTTLEYKETMTLDVENIASTSQQIWISMYEVIHDDYFKTVKFLPTEFLNKCIKKKWTSKLTK